MNTESMSDFDIYNALSRNNIIRDKDVHEAKRTLEAINKVRQDNNFVGLIAKGVINDDKGSTCTG